MKNTRIVYLYRDASNYKQGADLILAGALTAAQIARIWEICDAGGFFIAHDVGLPDLQYRWLDQGCTFPTEDDHVWSELEILELTSDPPTVTLTADALFQSFCAITVWDVAAAAQRLGFAVSLTAD